MPFLKNGTATDDDNHHEHLSRLWGNFIFIAIPFCCMIYLGVKLIRDNVRVIRERRQRLRRNGNQNQNQNENGIGNANANENDPIVNFETPRDRSIENALTEFINENNRICNKRYSKTDCSICLEEISFSNKKDIIELDCNHLFHKECLNPWIRNSLRLNNNAGCPLCREIIINI